MTLYDVTMPIRVGMAAYKNKQEHQPHIEKVRTIEQGSNETRVSVYSHSGTHIDAPYHILSEGYTLENIPLSQMYGKCKVLDLTDIDSCIELKHIEKYVVSRGDFIFFKTTNSLEDSFNPEFVYLSAEAAEYLVSCGVEVVGIDGLSVERNSPDHITHHTLLENNILIVEGLRLKDIPEGEYTSVIAPLLIVGGDGSPARVLLIKE
ncbi:MAG: cyclase family protein [Clostridia bacterium]